MIYLSILLIIGLLLWSYCQYMEHKMDKEELYKEIDKLRDSIEVMKNDIYLYKLKNKILHMKVKFFDEEIDDVMLTIRRHAYNEAKKDKYFIFTWDNLIEKMYYMNIYELCEKDEYLKKFFSKKGFSKDQKIFIFTKTLYNSYRSNYDKNMRLFMREMEEQKNENNNMYM